MKYFEELDAWLTDVLESDEEEVGSYDEWIARVKKQIKEKILESYRNGQKAGLPPAKAAPPADRSRESKPRKFWPRRGSQRQ